MNRLRIAYLSFLDPLDVKAWSGTHSSIYKELQKTCGDVTALGPHIEQSVINQGRVYSRLSRLITGKRFDYTHSIRLAKLYGRHFTEKLKEKEYDCIFAVSASTELAFLETTLPVYYTADATFANVLNYYPFYTNLSKRSKREGNEIQQRALDKCSKLFFPSEWAANSAIRDYNINAGKIEIVPFGANLTEVPASLGEHPIQAKTVHLLFVGVEWERKGGPTVIKAVEHLRNKGWNVSLTIVGCTPEIRMQGVEIIPYLNKNVPEQRKKMNELFLRSDFFILPTTAECFGLVFCEASAMGTPSIARDTGGVGGVIQNGINGFLIPDSANGETYAEKIISVLESGQYPSLRASSKALYDSKLNWDVWGNKVAEVLSATHSR
jgi:glycosyltransferase involved in cell wall biosynthesis